MIESTSSIEMFGEIILYIFRTLLNSVWLLITSSWILTSFLLMAVIGTLFTWVFPRDDKED